MITTNQASFLHRRFLPQALIVVVAFLGFLQAPVLSFAQDVAARISTRETYVGMPIVLEIQVANASDYKLPELFEIEGCRVESGGRPSTSSRVMISNGRRTESRSVTQTYVITPKREGKFEIPNLVVEVDGKTRNVLKQSFVVTKSETGDLMFVEIEGSKQKVYVGEPLDLKLKIWLKPFQDREQKIQLDDGNMWQMLSEKTSWGEFGDRVAELAENRQRPSGKEVLKDDGEGTERGYFLYELETTVYPDRPGKIDGSDVQVVVNYPLAIGRARDPFESIFDDRRSPASSMLQRMMSDDFGGGAPFGRRMSVTDSRPIVGEAKVDSTEVLPVPAKGRPSDYRGAVGQYSIVAQAEPKRVEAGDPITLRLDVNGNGPMELVQAPPLSEIDTLVKDFKISDGSLAGFAQDEAKIFVTSIRPKRAGITEIPPIPFSFFDPDKEEYVTAYSNPISISVDEAESLSLDSIVSNSREAENLATDGSEDGEPDLLPDFNNEISWTALGSREPPAQFSYWFFVVIPPFAWLALAITRFLGIFAGWLPSLRSARTRAIEGIEKAALVSDIENRLVAFIAEKTGGTGETKAEAIGSLRLLGVANEANKVESFLNTLRGCKNSCETEFAAQIVEAKSLVEELEKVIASNSRNQIQRRRNSRKTQIAGSLLFLILFNVSGSVLAQVSSPINKSEEEARWQAVLSDANRKYELAQNAIQNDAGQAKDLFEGAAQKYRLLSKEVVGSPDLHTAAGNAFYQSGELGRAIASYHRALKIDANHAQARNNLNFAESKLKVSTESDQKLTSTVSMARLIANANQSVIRLVGLLPVQVLVALASVLFWIGVSARTLGCKSALGVSIVRLSLIPLAVMMIAGGSLWLHENASEPRIAFVVVPELQLRDGDGEEFSASTTISESKGVKLKIVGQRGNWLKVESDSRQVGWVKQAEVESIEPLENE